MILSIVILLIALGIVFFTALTGGKDYRKLRHSKDTVVRQKIYSSWIRESWFLFGVPAVVGLWVLTAFNPGLSLPGDWLTLNGSLQSIVEGLSIGVIIGLLASIALNKWQAGKMSDSKVAELQTMIEKSGSGSLIAQNHKERLIASHLSLAAGICEELFFRLLLPVAMVSILGADYTVIALIISTALFGLAHLYQGIGGIIVTAIVGMIFTLLYVATGSILLVIAIHILIDLRSIVSLSWLTHKEPTNN